MGGYYIDLEEEIAVDMGVNFKKKLFISFFVVGLVLFSFIGSMYVFNINKGLSAQAFEKLTAVRQIKKSKVEAFIDARLDHVNDISKNRTIVDALQSFGSLVSQGSQPLEDTDDFFGATFDGILNKFKEKFDFLDLILVTPTGDIVYSTGQQSVLWQNLLTGDLKNFGAAICFQRAKEGLNILDLDAYPPADNKNILIAGAPVYLYGSGKTSDELVGVVMLKIDSSPINVMMQRSEGREMTGSTFLIGKRGTQSVFRSNLLNVGNARTAKIGDIYTTAYIEKALYGPSGQGVYQENKRAQLVSYAPLDVQGLNWAIVSKISQSEAFDAVDRRRWPMSMEVIIGIVVIWEVGALIWWISSASLSSWYWKI